MRSTRYMVDTYMTITNLIDPHPLGGLPTVPERETYGFQYPQIFGTGPLSNGIPAVTIDGITNYPAPTFVKFSPNTEISFNDNLTWIKGSHTFKTGLLIAQSKEPKRRSDQY